MKLFGLDKYFDFMGGAAGDNRDHKWQVLDYSLNAVGADRSRAILVGDRVYDAEGAAKCGIDSLGVRWGHGCREELENSGFTYLATTPDEVVELLIK
jgi:phosphoglycolate phosphatase